MQHVTGRKTILPRDFHSQNQYHVIDSFAMFKNRELVNLVKNSVDRISFMIPAYGLVATLQDDNSLFVTYNQGSYVIRVEQKQAYFSGYYFLFLCGTCDQTFRKLYCIEGVYRCRRCNECSYYSQRLNPYDRWRYNQNKIERVLEQQGGSIQKKPPWTKKRTHKKLQQKYQYYEQLYFQTAEVAFIRKYGTRAIPSGSIQEQ